LRDGGQADRPPWRLTFRLTVDAARSRPLAIVRMDEPEAILARYFSFCQAERSVSAGERLEQSLRATTTHSECRYAACRRHAQSHAYDSAAFHRLHTSAFCAADSLNCFPFTHKHHPSIEELLLDGVAATYRIHPHQGLRWIAKTNEQFPTACSQPVPANGLP